MSVFIRFDGRLGYDRHSLAATQVIAGVELLALSISITGESLTTMAYNDANCGRVVLCCNISSNLLCRLGSSFLLEPFRADK
jgi:hypothetical protein